RRDDVEHRWLDQVKADLGAREVSPSELRDSMPEYLDRLAEALRRDEPAELSGTAAWGALAREHALTRVKLGFDVDQLVRAFVILRRVLFEIVGEEGVVKEVGVGAQL